MEKNPSIICCLLASLLTFTVQCKKERSCDNCPTSSPTVDDNKPPIAAAGPDQTITLPNDSILLDGSASHDPNGRITAWQWKKISGPSSFNIANANTVRARATNLAEGVYQFELTVTDSLRLFDKDTTTVNVIRLFTNEIIFSDQAWLFNYTSFIIIPDLYTHLPAGVFFKVLMKRDSSHTWQEILQTGTYDFGFYIDNDDLWIMSLTGSNETDTPDIKIIY